MALLVVSGRCWYRPETRCRRGGLGGVSSVAVEFADSRRGRLLRQAAGVLVFVLDAHRELPVLTWTVTPDVLLAHADVCDLDPDRDRRVFTVWAQALPASEGRDPAPRALGADDESPCQARGHRSAVAVGGYQ